MAAGVTGNWHRLIPSLAFRRHAAGLVAAAAFVALSGFAGTAAAQTLSPALSPSKIEVNDPIGQGDEVSLPSLGVFNRSGAPALFEMDTLFAASQEQHVPDRSWFRFEPQSFRLEADEGREVEVSLKVPRAAELGAYRVLLRVRTIPSEDASAAGTSVRAAVATTLLFSVKNVNFHFYDPVVDFFPDRAPFSYIGTGLLLGLLATYLFQRRYGLDVDFGIRLRRK